MFTSRRIAIMGGDKFRDEYSLAFDGTDDYVDLGTAFSHNVHSIATWIKVTADANNKFIFDARDANDDGIVLYIDTDEDIKYQVVSVMGHYNTPTTSGWNHIVATNDGTTSRIYLNGVEVETADTSGVTVSTTTSGRIGARSHTSSASYFNGNISELAFYTSALSASQVKTLYNGREPYNHKEGVASSNLQAWYRMGDGSLDFYSGSSNGLISNVVNNTLGTDLNSTANATSIHNESNGTAGGWVNGDGSSNNQCSTYEASTDNAVSGTYTLHATYNDNNDRVHYSFSTTSGKPYLINVSIKITNHSASEKMLFRFGNTQNGTDHCNLSSYDINPTTDMYNYKFAIIASASTTFLTFRENGSDAADFYIDALSIKQVGDDAGIMVNLGNNFEGDTP